MAASTERQKAYARGYARGRSGRWPDHRPPAPPDEVLAPIVRAAQSLRDAADHICATISEDDEFALELAPCIDGFDSAMTKFGEWLRST